MTLELRQPGLDGEGRIFLVEARLDSTAELEAIVADYLARAERLGFVPSWQVESVVGRWSVA